jgi:hypothetical protein
LIAFKNPGTTEALRKITGDNASANTVLGYFEPARKHRLSLLTDPETISQQHYWTELTLEDKSFFCCATFPPFNKKFKEEIIFDERNHLPRYGLHRRYATDVMAFPEDQKTLSILEQNSDRLLANTHRPVHHIRRVTTIKYCRFSRRSL